MPKNCKISVKFSKNGRGVKIWAKIVRGSKFVQKWQGVIESGRGVIGGGRGGQNLGKWQGGVIGGGKEITLSKTEDVNKEITLSKTEDVNKEI